MKITAIIATILSLFAISFLVYGNGSSAIANFTAYAQPYLHTIKHRNLVIDLGNGVKTNAQLTLPAVGKGPFPGVLLIHGTGPVGMNETLGATIYWMAHHRQFHYIKHSSYWFLTSGWDDTSKAL